MGLLGGGGVLGGSVSGEVLYVYALFFVPDSSYKKCSPLATPPAPYRSLRDSLSKNRKWWTTGGKQGRGNRPPVDDGNPIRKFSITTT